MSMGRGADAFRIRSLASVNPVDINRMTITEAGERNILELSGGKWTRNGLPADSTQTVRFRSTLARLSGTKFEDGQYPAGLPSHTLIIEGNNFNPIELKAYPMADTNIIYLVTSSANPGAVFNGKEGGLFEKIWKGMEF
jgi:hypothetical protein